MYLTADIYSKVKPTHCYGRQGDEVRIVSKNHEIAIVEGTDKTRFPVPEKLLSRDKVAVKINAADPVQNIKPAPVKKKQSISQQSIF